MYITHLHAVCLRLMSFYNFYITSNLNSNLTKSSKVAQRDSKTVKDIISSLYCETAAGSVEFALITNHSLIRQPDKKRS